MGPGKTALATRAIREAVQKIAIAKIRFGSNFLILSILIQLI